MAVPCVLCASVSHSHPSHWCNGTIMNMPNKLLHVASLIVGAVIFAGAASAQTMEKRMLDLTGARKVIAAAVGEAQKRHTTGVVAVVDDGGNLIAVERIDNT